MWLGGRSAGFDVSGSDRGANERNATLRAPTKRRFFAMLNSNLLWMHLILIASSILGATLCLRRGYIRYEIGSKLQREYILTHLGWPPMLWMIFILSCAGPLHYALFPPSMPRRETMLIQDPVTKVVSAKQDATNFRWTRGTIGYEYYLSISVLYSLLLWLSMGNCE